MRRIHQRHELRVERIHLRPVEHADPGKIPALAEERELIAGQAHAVVVGARRRRQEPAYRVVPVGEVGCFNHLPKNWSTRVHASRRTCSRVK